MTVQEANGASPPEPARPRTQEDAPPRQTRGEEIANSITHGIGAGLAVAGLVLMVVFSALNGSAWHVVGTAIFGATLVLLYLSSTLYHALPQPRVKRVFRVFDHSSIYLLIAGTYTPFTLVTLRGPWGWTIFGVIWGLAAAGVTFKAFFTGKFDRLSTAIYLAMGWMILLAIQPMWAAMDGWGLAWLILGGLCYSAGTLFYSMDQKVPFLHSIWHLFVLGGSICHFFCVLWHVVPGG